MTIFLVLVFALLFSFILTFYIRKVAIKRKLMDTPNERSMHTVPVPRLGGLAIVSTWFISLIVLHFLDKVEDKLFYALLCGLIIAIISLIDDIKPISAKFRLLVHFLTTILAFYFLGGLRQFFLFDIEFSYIYFFYPVVIIGMVWFINLFNFMDGIDGYAAIEAISISLMLLFFSGSVVPSLLIFCIGGFLYWNLSSQKKIFMGDMGSTQLGFILIVLGIYFHNKLDVSILNWLMIAAPFWFDASYTLFKRWYKKEKLGQAHRKHAYQRLVQMGFSHKTVNLFLITLNFLIFLMTIIYRRHDELKLPLTTLTIILLYIIYKRIDKRVPF